MAAKRTDAPALDELGFEALLDKLESLVDTLESGDLPLEKSLQLYEEGVGVVRAAKGRLDGMERRLEQLLADGTTTPIGSVSNKASAE